MKMFPAHIRYAEQNGGVSEQIQTVQEHCRNTAAFAEAALLPAGLGKSAYLAGLLHDLGKFTPEFAVYLQKAVRGEQVHRGSVNHTFAGVRFLLEQYHTKSKELSFADITAELLAYAVGAHHGLFDLMGEQADGGFEHRLQAEHLPEGAETQFLAQCASKQELDALFKQSTQELTSVFERLIGLADADEQHLEFANENIAFYVGLLARLLLSAVIEGDRRDTAEFQAGLHEPTCPECQTRFWQRNLDYLEKKLGQFPQDTDIQKARRKISDQCAEAARSGPGLLRLNVPTGGGKTLSALRFALAHAAHNNSRRIVFAMPLLSIIDQNSQAIREFVQDKELVFEHHSNVVRTDESGAELDLNELLTESWAAPLIVTTLVQLLNTLFAGQTSAIRRFQALCGSIIVLDEVQTVPNNMLSLFNLAVNFLVEVCGATVVLCSATQPSLGRAEHPLIVPVRDMVPYEKDLWQIFARTKLLDAGSMTMDELESFIRENRAKHRTVLVVCNKKAQAAELYGRMQGGTGYAFHLSASMCMAHRRRILEQMTPLLHPGQAEPVLCVSTQVIEAGVDVSFDCVIRLLAGLDSAVQAAGRCNRNGEAARQAPVYMVQCIGEDMSRLQDISRAQNATRKLMLSFHQEPERFHHELSSDQAVDEYYKNLYQAMERGYQDFPLPKQHCTILSLLAENETFAADQSSRFYLRQAFKTAGRLFCVFDDQTTDLLVPYGVKGRAIIADLCSARSEEDLAYRRQILDRAKEYTISIFRYQLEQLQRADGLVYLCAGSILALGEEFYSEQLGLTMEPSADNNMGVNLCIM